MLLTAALILLLLGLFTRSDTWVGLGAFTYFGVLAVAVAGWGLTALSAIIPSASGWGGVLLSLVTTPLELPLWQSITIATVLFLAAIATLDAETSESTDSAEEGTAASDPDEPPTLEDLRGIGETKAAALRDAGYTDQSDVSNASKTELADVNGIGTATAARLKAQLKDNDSEASRPRDTEREKPRLVAGLEMTCDRIETLADTGNVAEANDRVETAHDAVDETMEVLGSLSGDRDLRMRTRKVKTRLEALPTEAEARYVELIEAGDTQVTNARDAVEAGDVYQGLRACETARSAYQDAQQIRNTNDDIPGGGEKKSITTQLDTVESLTDRLQEEKQVQQVETAIEKLGQQVNTATAGDSTRDPQEVVKSAVEDGVDALTHLPDETDTRDLQRRITELHKQVDEFETVAEQLTTQSSSASPDTDSDNTQSTQNDSGESVAETATQPDTTPPAESVDCEETSRSTPVPKQSSSVVRTADEISDTARLTETVVLQIREHLSEDARRNVFRADTITGESVQLDIWNRHVNEFTLEPDTWYAFEAARGQRWTVDGVSGVTVSTTSDVTITEYDSTPDPEMASSESHRR